LAPLLGLGHFFNFLIFFLFFIFFLSSFIDNQIQLLDLLYVGRTPWTEDQSVARPLPAHKAAEKQNKGTEISMPQVGFEPTIPVFQGAKRVHALDSAVNVIGWLLVYLGLFRPVLVYVHSVTYSGFA
jgi:hypothetical protein